MSESTAPEAPVLEALHQLAEAGRVSARVAHDLNNLLTAIAMASAQLSRHALSPAVQQLPADILHACRMAQQLTGCLLQLGRQPETAPAPIALDPLVDELAGLLRHLLGPTIEFELQLEAGGARVVGRAVRLQQILLNLAVNAREAMGEGGKLMIRTRAGAEEVELTVADTGRGIESEHLPRLFEPYYTGRAGGVGLGLAIVRRVVDEHGGRVEVGSRPGSGSTFRIFLPRCSDRDPA